MFPSLILRAILAGGLPSGAADPVVVLGPTAPLTVTPMTAKKYVVKRLRRTDTELAERAREILSLFSAAEPSVQLLESWSRTSLAQDPKRWLQVHPLPEKAPGLVVMYQPLNDDLIVMDLELLHRPPWPPVLGPEPVIPEVGIGEAAAQIEMEDTVTKLEELGVIPLGFAPSSAEIGTYREKVQNGTESAAWIMEYQWTMNRVVDGVEVVDAGIRIGVHHEGRVSTIRVTDVEITEVVGSEEPVVNDADRARQLFLDAVRAQHGAAAVHIEEERVAVVLDPDQSNATLSPGVLFNYSLRFTDPSTGDASVSRQQLTSVPLTEVDVHGVFPIPGSI